MELVNRKLTDDDLESFIQMRIRQLCEERELHAIRDKVLVAM